MTTDRVTDDGQTAGRAAAGRKVRRAQAISPSGVGAIVDVVGESFVAEDVGRWRGRREVLPAPRVAALFNVAELCTPPAMEARGAGIPFYRFPQWLFCGRCRVMTRWHPKREKPGQPPRCGRCPDRPPQLVPMRFVAVCGNGHLDDVDWQRWAHSATRHPDQRRCGSTDLRFRHVPRVGGGLESLEVRCGNCNAARDLGDLPGPQALASVGQRCCGCQPWQGTTDAEDCDETPVVLQRGASSVYFPDVVSALDLPPDSDWTAWGGPDGRIEHNDNFKLLLTNPDHPLREGLIRVVAQEAAVIPDRVRQSLVHKLGPTAQPSGYDTDIDDLPRQEWQALTAPLQTHDPRDHFIAHATDFPAPGGHRSLDPVAAALSACLHQVTIVDRLREIRVLRGFRRHTMNRTVRADLGRDAGFLPAIEVFGEGIFIRFNEDRIARWSADPDVVDRSERLRRRLATSFRANWVTTQISPRLVLLHTFAHLLMRQLSISAGYSSSSLRERLYAADPADTPPMAGVLIYTAAGDAEGTLGGLARLGEAERLVPALAATLDAARWCSSDPVCREASAQGPDGLSLAACHACALASETSCVLGNVLLDRALVVDDDVGYLRQPLTALLDTRTDP